MVTASVGCSFLTLCVKSLGLMVEPEASAMIEDVAAPLVTSMKKSAGLLKGSIW